VAEPGNSLEGDIGIGVDAGLPDGLLRFPTGGDVGLNGGTSRSSKPTAGLLAEGVGLHHRQRNVPLLEDQFFEVREMILSRSAIR
jgi:hypothetical protein